MTPPLGLGAEESGIGIPDRLPAEPFVTVLGTVPQGGTSRSSLILL